MTTITLSADTAAKFERILDLEDALNAAKCSQLFAPNGTSDYRHGQMETRRQSAQTRLFAAIEALTAEEAAAFGAYRIQARA